MKKELKFSLWILMVTVNYGYSQKIAEYVLGSYSNTYQTIQNANPVIPLGSSSEGAWQNLPIGFSFVYEGTSYITASASTNGFIQLGSTVNYMDANMKINNLSSKGGVVTVPGPVIAPLWDDLKTKGFFYQTTGMPGNRVFIIEWSKVAWADSAPQESISFQLKLYETSNKIEFIYKTEPGLVVNGATASIGIKGSSNSFLSLQSDTPNPLVRADFEKTTIRTKPLDGQVYSFTPFAAPAAPRIHSDTNPSAGILKLEWNYNSSDQISYVLQQKVGVNGLYVDIYNGLGSIYQLPQPLTHGVNYYFRVKYSNSPYSSELHYTPLDINEYTFKSSVQYFSLIQNPITYPLQGTSNSGAWQNIPIGFTFPYAGTDFNSVSASTNGLVKLGADSYLDGDANEDENMNDLLNPFIAGPLLAPLWDDLKDAEFSTELEVSGNGKIFKMVWANAKWGTLATLPAITFMVRLYESGRIDFVYAPLAGSAENPSASIGIRGISFANNIPDLITLVSPTPNAIAQSGIEKFHDLKPVTGQVYSFIPNVAPNPPQIISITGAIGEASLKWDHFGDNIEYTLEQKVGINGSYLPISSSKFKSITLSGLTKGQDYFFRLKRLDSPYSDEVKVTLSDFFDYQFESLSDKFNEIHKNDEDYYFQGDRDNGAWQNISLGFNFKYAGAEFSKASASTNGFVRLGADALIEFPETQTYINSLHTEDYAGGPLLAPLWDDLKAGDITDFTYSTEGTAPGRVFTMQWRNMLWSKWSNQATISFQTKLYEKDGAIEFIYRDEMADVAQGSASIGMRGIGIKSPYLQYVSLKDTSPNPLAIFSAENSTLNVKPATGQIYRFYNPQFANAVNDKSEELSIYPNPAGDWITVQGTFRESLMEVRDDLGVVLGTVKLDGTDPRISLLPLSLKNGNLYYLRVENMTTRIIFNR
jgi:hypothetical protein